MKKQIICLVCLLFSTGCAKIAHMQQLLTLKGYSEEQERLDQYVLEQNQKFEALLESIRQGTLGEYETSRDVQKVFGDPIYTEKIIVEDQQIEKWLYRYSTQFFDSDKVYLYFNEKGHLVDWEHQPAKEISKTQKEKNL